MNKGVCVVIMVDAFGRKITYLRISVTDRCNLRCTYCMPDGICTVPMSALLTFEEITAVAAAAVSEGITQFKITGGEPLVRRGITDLIRMIYNEAGAEEVTLTTNGLLLSTHLPSLMEEGIRSVNVSLDTLDREQYAAITGVDALSVVLQGVEDALRAGMKVKINAVLQKGVNEDQFLPLVELARNRAIDVRFIEMMPVGVGRTCKGLSNVVLRDRLREYALKTVGVPPTVDETAHGNGPACYDRIQGFRGSIGFISAIHEKFCADCNRLRLTSMGRLQPCLCYGTGVDLKEVLRSEYVGDRMQALREAFRKAVAMKPAGHVFEDMARVSEEPMLKVGG